jgi:hypothetical protein
MTQPSHNSGISSGSEGTKEAVIESDATPTAQEVEEILSALNVIDSAADRVIGRLDRSHDLLQDTIREVRSTRLLVEESNNRASGLRFDRNAPIPALAGR